MSFASAPTGTRSQASVRSERLNTASPARSVRSVLSSLAGTPIPSSATPVPSTPLPQSGTPVPASATPVPNRSVSVINVGTEPAQTNQTTTTSSSRKTFEATSRFNHRIKSKHLNSNDFTVNLNIDKVNNPTCSDSPKFNNAIINKEANKYTLLINIGNYDPSTIKVEPDGDKIIVKAYYKNALNEKKTEYGELKHSYRLPNAEVSQVTSGVRSDGQLVIEVPFSVPKGKEHLLKQNFPVVSKDGKTVTYEHYLPDKLDASNVTVNFDGNKVLIRGSEKFNNSNNGPSSTESTGGSVCYYHSVTFPAKTDFSTLRHSISNNLLTVTAVLTASPPPAPAPATPTHSIASRGSKLN